MVLVKQANLWQELGRRIGGSIWREFVHILLPDFPLVILCRVGVRSHFVSYGLWIGLDWTIFFFSFFLVIHDTPLRMYARF